MSYNLFMSGLQVGCDRVTSRLLVGYEWVQVGYELVTSVLQVGYNYVARICICIFFCIAATICKRQKIQSLP